MSRALAYLVAARRSEIKELDHLSHTCELVLAINALVHALQQERGAANLFLASAGSRFAALRHEQIKASDAALIQVHAWLDEKGAPLDAGPRLLTRIAQALQALDALPDLRAAIDQQGLSAAVATERYHRLIGVLLALVFEAADIAVDPTISRLLVALFHLMQGKEFAGQERALGASAFASGQITANQASRLEYLIEMQEQSWQRFEDLADDLKADWRALQATLALSQLERLRRILLAAHTRPLDAAQADSWFTCCTQRMDQFHHLEIHLAGKLRALCQQRSVLCQQELEDPHQQTLSEVDDWPPLLAFTVQIDPAAERSVAPRLTQAVVDLLHEQARRLHDLTEELNRVKTSLNERKLIDKAKTMLMTHHGLKEEEAYRLLRQNAMNKNLRLVDVAQTVLSFAEMLPGKP